MRRLKWGYISKFISPIFKGTQPNLSDLVEYLFTNFVCVEMFSCLSNTRFSKEGLARRLAEVGEEEYSF